MGMQNSATQSLYDLLITRDLEPELLDSAGKPVSDPEQAELLSFDWKTANRDYGTVVVLMGPENNLEVYYGDNLGRGMEADDKSQWYQFLEQLKRFAATNLLKFDLNDISRLRYTMQGMAAIREGLFEGYYGTRKVSYNDQPKKTKLVIKHNKTLGEGDARYRYIESLFVETADGERFRVPSRSLTHGRMLARHVSEGGTPYDAFGQHITSMISEMGTMARFVKTARHRQFTGEAASLLDAAIKHYADLKAKAKRMISQRGYKEARQTFDPTKFTDAEVTAESIRDIFIEQTLDHRIEEALPVLARLAEEQNIMGEVREFDNWTQDVCEGTWALPNTPESMKKLQDLMSRELIVGPDATNATEQLYDLVGDDKLFDILDDISVLDPDANAWDDPRVQRRLADLGIDMPAPATPVSENTVGRYEPVDIKGSPREGDIHEIPGAIRFDMLPGLDRVRYEREDYSDNFYFRDPISGKDFVIYFHGRIPRIRGIEGMPESRVKEIAQSIAWNPTREDIDTDGVMMQKPSNMSSESKQPRDLDLV